MTAKKVPDSSLRTRAVSAAIFGPAVLIVVWIGKLLFSLALAAAALAGAFEWSRMVMTGKRPPRLVTRLASGACALGVLAAGLNFDSRGFVNAPVLSFSFLLALAFLLFCYNYALKGPSLRELLLGVLYVGFGLDVMIWLRNGSEAGRYHMFTLLLVIWASDVSAYFAGKAIGGPKLAPKISPKKTWAGFFGSSLGAGLVAAALAVPPVAAFLGGSPLMGAGPLGYFALGFVLGAVGQMGDLFKSIFKRRYGLKDMGSLIPGHGGVLDRIDALLSAALVFGTLAMVTG